MRGKTITSLPAGLQRLVLIFIASVGVVTTGAHSLNSAVVRNPIKEK